MKTSKQRPFTPEEDETLVRMREDFATWDEIGRAIGCIGTTVRARAAVTRPDLTVSNRERAAAAAAREAEENPEPAVVMVSRPEGALPVRHVISWSAIFLSSQLPLTD